MDVNCLHGLGKRSRICLTIPEPTGWHRRAMHSKDRKVSSDAPYRTRLCYSVWAIIAEILRRDTLAGAQPVQAMSASIPAAARREVIWHAVACLDSMSYI